jgi:hypothetical protein
LDRARIKWLWELLDEAKDEIIFISTSHEIAARFKQDLTRKIIEKGIEIEIMVLNPNSPEVTRKEILFQINDLAEIIQKSLIKLCRFKTTLKQNNVRLIIKTYDSDVSNSYIVIDPRTDDAVVKIEELTGGDPEKRPSSLCYKRDNFRFFEENWKKVKELQKVENYECD